jgi:hypothetical protein
MPPPPLVQWGTNDPGTPRSQSNPVLPAPVPASPAVPSQYGGSGATSVNTPSLDVFATNMGQLVDMARNALSQLTGLPPVAPGAFYHAYQIQDKVSGASGSSNDLVANYQGVLTDLANGLTDIQSAAQNMSQKYTTTDDLNNMSVTDLQNDLSVSQGDFTGMMSANGGSGSGSGSNSSNSSSS